MGGKTEIGVFGLYSPFVKECTNNLLFDWIIGEGWYAVQVFFTAVWQEKAVYQETDTIVPACFNNTECYLWGVALSEGKLSNLICATYVPCFFLKRKEPVIYGVVHATLAAPCVCLYMNDGVCTVCVSSACAWCIDILYLPNVSAFALDQPACVTICHLFVPLPEIPDTPTIHHSSHRAGATSSLVVTTEAEWLPWKPHAAEHTCADISLEHFTLLSLHFRSAAGIFCGGF